MFRFNVVLEDLQTWGDGLAETIRKNLIPNLGSFLVQFCAFVVLLLVVIFFAYKPVKKMLKKRQDYIEQEISDAEKSKAEAKINLEQSEQAVTASKKTASQIIEDANIQAKKQQEEILAEARKEVELMKTNAQKDIERSRQEALDDIHKEMVEVALLTSEEILKREVNKKDNARLAEDFIDKL